MAMSSMVASPLPSAQGDAAVEHLGHHQGFGAALFEAAEVDQPGADDLGLVDGRNPGHGDEDALLAGHLDDDAHHVRGAAGSAGEHHDVAQPAQTVAQGVEDVQAQKARNEDAGRIRAHPYRLPSLLSFS